VTLECPEHTLIVDPWGTAPWLVEIVTFLNAIGIVTRAGTLATESFLPGVLIDHGTLLFEPAKIAAPSDLLHEAGHIAVTPLAYRHCLHGALSPDHAFDYGGEVEAIAWSFAAATAIKMPLTELFHPMGYRGQAPALAMSFALGVYPGVHGLVNAGLAANARLGSLGAYPTLLRWLRA
jgi:hypothetical protein